MTFARPFRLDISGAEFPPGRYVIEGAVDGASFPFYRRTATLTQLIADPLGTGSTETAVMDVQQLEAALEGRRRSGARCGPGHHPGPGYSRAAAILIAAATSNPASWRTVCSRLGIPSR